MFTPLLLLETDSYLFSFSQPTVTPRNMARGNQRDADRAKAQKKLLESQKGQGKEGSVLSRNTADKIALDAKKVLKAEQAEQAKKDAVVALALDSQKANMAKVSGKSKKVDVGLDDLLNAGLAKGNKGKK